MLATTQEMRLVTKARRAGRKAKPGLRSPTTGRLVQQSREETIQDRQAVVLAQPHRRSADPHANERASLVGRLVLDGRVRVAGTSERALLRAAEAYSRAWSDVQWLLDSRKPHRTPSSRRGSDPTEEDRKRIERRWGDLRRAARDSGALGVIDALAVIVLDSHPEDYNPPFWAVHGAGQGLAGVARYEGFE